LGTSYFLCRFIKNKVTALIANKAKVDGSDTGTIGPVIAAKESEDKELRESNVMIFNVFM
jgi:hypothetical protein